ncbi:MAG: FAD-binding protein [Lachnospiraceae bacterium]
MGKGTNLLVADGGWTPLSCGWARPYPRPGCCPGTASGPGRASRSRSSPCSLADAGLSGLEFAHGIPGSLGGAVFMNAGAYGGEMKDVLQSAELALPDGTVSEVPRQELELSLPPQRA